MRSMASFNSCHAERLSPPVSLLLRPEPGRTLTMVTNSIRSIDPPRWIRNLAAIIRPRSPVKMVLAIPLVLARRECSMGTTARRAQERLVRAPQSRHLNRGRFSWSAWGTVGRSSSRSAKLPAEVPARRPGIGGHAQLVAKCIAGELEVALEQSHLLGSRRGTQRCAAQRELVPAPAPHRDLGHPDGVRDDELDGTVGGCAP